jgi:hypothetical protein
MTIIINKSHKILVLSMWNNRIDTPIDYYEWSQNK